MSLLTKAKVITTPTAYSDGILHSIKPNNAENLLLQSNQFDTTWSLFNGTLTSGQSGYDGTNDAWLLDASATLCNVEQGISESGINTFSVYAKAGTQEGLFLRLDGGSNPRSFFNLSDGTIGSQSGSISNIFIQDVGNGWYRCGISTDESITIAKIYVATPTTFPTSGSIYIQDAQLNKGLTADQYIETTTETSPRADFTFTRNSSATRVGEDGYIQDIATNLPRINYEGGKGHLLLEGQSTNLITYSEDLNNYFTYQIDTTITNNYGTSPDNTLNSSRIEFADSTAFVYEPVTISTEHTASVYVKGVEGETIMFGFGANVTSGDIYTFTGNWQKISFTASSATQIFLSTYGDATARDFEAFGLQLEENSYPTSYIPTNGSAVTRAAETCNNAGNADLFDSEGVLYADIAALANDLSERQISIDAGGSTVNRIIIRYNNVSNNINAYAFSNAVQGGQFNYVADDITEFNKVAIRYKDNDFSFWANGVQIRSYNTGTAPTGLSELNFDFGGGFNFYGKTKMVAVFPYLSNDEMECLTGEGYGSFEAMALANNYTII